MDNLYLVGVMGCGKTTVGRLLASQLGLRFVDMDACIEVRAGTTIPRIFETQGEESFRDMESALLDELAQQKDAVISTGGGVVLRRENVESMKNSGKIVWIRRSLDVIASTVSTQNRPLLKKGADALYDIYKQRESLYMDAAYFRVSNDGSAQDCADAIVQLLKQR